MKQTRNATRILTLASAVLDVGIRLLVAAGVYEMYRRQIGSFWHSLVNGLRGQWHSYEQSQLRYTGRLWQDVREAMGS